MHDSQNWNCLQVLVFYYIVFRSGLKRVPLNLFGGTVAYEGLTEPLVILDRVYIFVEVWRAFQVRCYSLKICLGFRALVVQNIDILLICDSGL